VVKENAEGLVVATKEIGVEVNADKTKYMIMSRHLIVSVARRFEVSKVNQPPNSTVCEC